jgi:uncharacterized coiled-coil protein SlyX
VADHDDTEAQLDLVELARRDPVQADVLRRLRRIQTYLDGMDLRMREGESRFASLESHRDSAEKTIDDFRKLIADLATIARAQQDRLLVLETRFAIVWAGLGVGCTSGISGLCLGVWSAMKGAA